MKETTIRRIILIVLFVAAVLPSFGQTPANRSYATSLVIPVAASKAGALGTYFRTDVSITNHSSDSVEVHIGLYPSGIFYYGDPYLESMLTLPPGTTTFENIVENRFRWNGFFGTIVLNNPIYVFNPELKLSATYRIWTPGPGGSGTMSQSSTAIDLLSLPSGTESRVAIAVRHDSDFPLQRRDLLEQLLRRDLPGHSQLGSRIGERPRESHRLHRHPGSPSSGRSRICHRHLRASGPTAGRPLDRVRHQRRQPER
jgi:hypothetical protein